MRQQVRTKMTEIRMRISVEKRNELAEMFESLGLSIQEATNIFYARALRVGGIPFEMRRTIPAHASADQPSDWSDN